MNEEIEKAVSETEEKRDYESEVRNLCLMDNLLFRNVFDEEPGLIGKLISAVLGEHVEITEVTVQKTITNGAGREMRCDATAKDKDRNGYVAEVQNQTKGMNPKRMRFNLGLIDHHAMMRGETDWEKMTDSTVIMFCACDYIGQGKAKYVIVRYLEGKGHIEDGTRMIYVNGEYRGDDELGKIIHDLMCRNADEIYDDEIREKVKRVKEDRVEVDKMCETLQREYEAGIKKGEAERNKLRAELDKKDKLLDETNRMLDEKDKKLDEKDKMINAMKEMLQKAYGPDIMNIVAEMAAAG